MPEQPHLFPRIKFPSYSGELNDGVTVNFGQFETNGHQQNAERLLTAWNNFDEMLAALIKCEKLLAAGYKNTPLHNMVKGAIINTVIKKK